MSFKLYTFRSSGAQIAFIDLLLGAARKPLHRVKVIAVLVIGHAVPNNWSGGISRFAPPFWSLRKNGERGEMGDNACWRLFRSRHGEPTTELHRPTSWPLCRILGI